MADGEAGLAAADDDDVVVLGGHGRVLVGCGGGTHRAGSLWTRAAAMLRCALKRRRRSALETTEMLEKTIARLAMTGLSRPMAASGMAATL